MKICQNCNETKSLEDFEPIKNIYRRNSCRSCVSKRAYSRDPEKSKERNKKRSERDKIARSDKSKRPHYIIIDSRSSDKKKGFDNDLNIDFVTSLIQRGCYYCETIDDRMTLDRINNNIGHIKSNVNACCTRCNQIRLDMPYEAWEIIVPAVKTARKLGLFGNWNGLSNKGFGASGKN